MISNEAQKALELEIDWRVSDVCLLFKQEYIDVKDFCIIEIEIKWQKARAKNIHGGGDPTEIMAK